MKKLNNEIDILSETAVFDYVAGHMSESAVAHFRKNLADNQALQKMVDAEKLLRAQLKTVELDESSLNPIGETSLNKLLTTIDELDENSSKNIQADQQFIQKKRPNNQWFGLTAIAASVALAIVLLLNHQPALVTPKYELLSDETPTTQIELNELITANKVAQIWLDNELSPEQLSILFSQYELTPIGRAGQAWVVSSVQVLSQQHLATLKSVEEFKEINVISYE